MKRLFLVLIILAMQTTLLYANEDVIRINIWREAAPLDPAYSTVTENVKICSVAFDSLVQVKADGNVTPAEAKSWTVSEDKLTYTFKLRDDIFWSDKVPVTAADYVLAFQRIVDPNVKEAGKINYLASNFKNANKIIEGKLHPEELGVRAVDDKTLEITIEAPASYFIALLAYPGMAPVPKHIIKEKGDNWYQSIPLVSNGPFTIFKADKTGLFFRARKNHWDAPAFSQLEFIYTASQNELLRDIVIERLDIVEGVHRDQAEWTEGREKIEAMHINVSSTLYAILNTKTLPFSDIRARKAIRALIDINFLASGAKAKSAHMFAPPQLRLDKMAREEKTVFPNRRERVEKAEKILAELGYTAENPLVIELLTADFADYERVSFGLLSSLQIPSTKVTLKDVEYAEIYQFLGEGKFQISLGLWYADYPDPISFYTNLESRNPSNFSSWHNQEYDNKLAKAYTTQERSKREVMYSEMENLILDEVPIIPILHNVLSVFYRDKIDKPQVNPILGLDLRHLKLKQVAE